MHRVVARLLDARQDVVAELGVAGDLFLLRAHADVRLVDERRERVLLRLHGRALVLPHVGLGRVVDLRAEELRLLVLAHVARIGGDALAVSALPAHLQPEVVAVADQLDGDFALPVVRAGLAEDLEARVDLPLREVADEPHARRVRRPLAEDPVRLLAPAPLHLVEPVVLVRTRPVRERHLAARQLPDERERVFGTTADRAFERFQVGIIQEFRHAGPPCALLQRVHVPEILPRNDPCGQVSSLFR